MIDNRLFEKYDGLIFDMDGTLIDTMPVHARAWNMVGEQFGYRFNSQIMYDLGGATVSTTPQPLCKGCLYATRNV